MEHWIKKCICLVVVVFCGCTTTQYIPIEKASTDTVYKSIITRDSLWLHDSIYVKEISKGDTVFLNIEKWHTKYKETFIHDTLYQSKTDTIPVPYPVTKYVEKELSWWQQTCMYIAYAVIALLVIFFGWKIVKNKLF